MSDRLLEILTDSDSRLSMNYIPSGRQLHRTLPLLSVKKHLDFCNDDSNEETTPIVETDIRDEDDNNQNMTFHFNKIGIKPEPDDPDVMLKGMKGYQPTPADLEFIKEIKVEKHIIKLQGDLEEVHKLLKNEMIAFKLACASREQARANLKNLPSCDDLTEWVKAVLTMTSPATEFTGLDAKSLLIMVTEENIQTAMDEKRMELARMKKKVANKREKEVKDRRQLEKRIAGEQTKIQGLMNHLSDLKSQLAQQEESYKALELRSNSQEAPAEEVETSVELQAAKTRAKRRGKGKTKAVKSTEKLEDTRNQSKPTRAKISQTGVKDDRANKNTSETLKRKQKSAAAVQKLVKEEEEEGPQRKVEERESDSQESVRAVRGRRKPAKGGEAPSTSQQEAASSDGRKQAAVSAGGAGEEEQHPVLRRSKRIANRSCLD